MSKPMPFEPGMPVSDHPDAELLRQCEAFDKADREVARLNGLYRCSDREMSSATKHWYAAIRTIRRMTPRTPEGQRAKARVAYIALKDVVDNHGGPKDGLREEHFALSALAEFARDSAP